MIMRNGIQRTLLTVQYSQSTQDKSIHLLSKLPTTSLHYHYHVTWNIIRTVCSIEDGMVCSLESVSIVGHQENGR